MRGVAGIIEPAVAEALARSNKEMEVARVEMRTALAARDDARRRTKARRAELKQKASVLRRIDPHNPLLMVVDAALARGKPAIATKPMKPPVFVVPPSAKGKWVYFVQAVEGGPIKIGVTNDMDERLHALQCGSPVRLKVIAMTAGDHRDEARIHRRLKAHRLHGEWFTDCSDVQALIRAVAP